MPINALPTPPLRTDPTNFAARGDAFLAALPAFVTQANETATAMNLNSTTDASTSSVLIGTGAKTFTVTAGKSFQPGMWLVIASTAAPSTNAMNGTITSYSGTTLSMNIVSVMGSGTFAAWAISQSAPGGTANLISNTPAGGIAATTVQAAIDELDVEKADKGAIQAQSHTAVTTAGTATAYVVATLPVQPSLVAGQRYRIKLHTPNGASPTLVRDGLAAVALRVYNSAGVKVAPAVGALPTLFDVEYDGVDYVVLTPLPGASAGANVDITSLGNNTSTVYATAGTATAYTIAPNPAITAYAAGQAFKVSFGLASGAAPTLQINGIATPPNLVMQVSAGTYANVVGIPAGHTSEVRLLSATQALVVTMPPASVVVNGAFRSIQIFTASGTYTKPAGLVRAKITVVGGGGAGNISGAAGALGGAGGGGGAAIRYLEAASIGATEAVTVGAGGFQGTASLAVTGGGTSSFGTLASATGGGLGTTTASPPVGGSGGVGSGGTLNVPGGSGLGQTPGGSTLLGGGTPPAAAATGRAYGGGGSGGPDGNFGGPGAAGVVIVEEFF